MPNASTVVPTTTVGSVFRIPSAIERLASLGRSRTTRSSRLDLSAVGVAVDRFDAGTALALATDGRALASVETADHAGAVSLGIFAADPSQLTASRRMLDLERIPANGKAAASKTNGDRETGTPFGSFPGVMRSEADRLEGEAGDYASVTVSLHALRRLLDSVDAPGGRDSERLVELHVHQSGRRPIVIHAMHDLVRSGEPETVGVGLLMPIEPDRMNGTGEPDGVAGARSRSARAIRRHADRIETAAREGGAL